MFSNVIWVHLLVGLACMEASLFVVISRILSLNIKKLVRNIAYNPTAMLPTNRRSHAGDVNSCPSLVMHIAMPAHYPSQTLEAAHNIHA